MWLRLVTGAVLVSLLTGCSTVREVDLDSGGSQLAEINAAVEGKSVSVEFASGKAISGLKLEVGPDTTCWTEWDRSPIKDGDEEWVCVPTSEVYKITVHRRLKGCFVGGGSCLSAVVAAVVITAIALSPGLEEAGGWTLLYCGVIGGAVGTVVGAVFGASRSKDVYILNP